MIDAIINCLIKIGSWCIIKTGTMMYHDNIIEDYIHISSGANLAGTVVMKDIDEVGISS